MEMWKEWLKNLINEEIENEKGTISNEHLWENGMNNEEYNVHTQNIEEHEKYLRVLEEIKSSYLID